MTIRAVITIRTAIFASFAAMLLAGCSGSGNGDPSGTVTARITAPTPVDERTTAAISAMGTSAEGNAITSYSWAIAADNDLNVSIENPTAQTTNLIVGEIAATVTIILQVTVRDSSGATGVEQVEVTLNEIDAALLPPMPDAQMSMQSVLGIDTDNDGVRDDVEHSIYGLYPLDTPRRRILLVGANAIQSQIEAGLQGDRALVDAASERSAEFAACGISLGIQGLQQDRAALEVFSQNTPARRNAFLAYDAFRVGTIQRAIDPATADCSFAF